MTIPDTLSNILIEGNTIDAGSSLTYGTLLSSGFADCRIFGNYFSGIANDSVNSNMLVLAGCSCNVQGNTFVRGSSSIASFILTDTSNDHMITNNVFDGYTTDGTNTSLTSGISSNTLYTANKNQVGYAIIPLGTNKSTLFNVASSFTPFYVYNAVDYTSFSTTLGVTSGAFFDDYVLKIFDARVSPAASKFSIGVDISSHIPVGAKIINAKISVYNPSSIPLDTSDTNQFALALSAGRSHSDSIDIKTHDSGGTLSWMLGFNSTANLIINSGNEASMRSNYQVIEIPTLNYTGFVTDSSGTATPVSDVDISTNYVAGNDYGLTAKLTFLYKATSQGADNLPLIVISPLIITYVF